MAASEATFGWLPEHNFYGLTKDGQILLGTAVVVCARGFAKAILLDLLPSVPFIKHIVPSSLWVSWSLIAAYYAAMHGRAVFRHYKRDDPVISDSLALMTITREYAWAVLEMRAFVTTLLIAKSLSALFIMAVIVALLATAVGSRLLQNIQLIFMDWGVDLCRVWCKAAFQLCKDAAKALLWLDTAVCDAVKWLQWYALPWAMRMAGEAVERSLGPRGYPEYQYKPFNDAAQEIRLLVIQRQQLFWGHLRCSLIQAKINMLPPYEALSYRWAFGNSDKKRRIYLDNQLFFIPESSYQLLHARSSVWRERVVWIDAICINQADSEERSRQLPLMQVVYSNATRVIIWPGDRWDSGMAASMMGYFISLYGAYENAQNRFEELWETHLETRHWKAMSNLVSDLYFTRMWVVQEVALGNEVQLYMGRQYVPWDIFLGVLQECGNPQRRDALFSTITAVEQKDAPILKTAKWGPSGALLIAQLRQRSEIVFPGGIPDLGHLLNACYAFECSDPRDKVFALNGLLLPDTLPTSLLSYHKPVQEVYLEVACIALRSQRDPLAILHHAGVGWDRKVDGLPSWVVDWSNTRMAHAITLGNVGIQAWEYATANGMEPGIKLPEPDRSPVLRVKGLVVGRIITEMEALSEKSDPMITGEDMVFARSRWFLKAQKLSWLCSDVDLATQQRSAEAFARTISGDRSIGRPAPDYFIEACNIYSQQAQARREAEELGIPKETRERFANEHPLWRLAQLTHISVREYSEFLTAFVEVTDNRKFAVTDSFHMCLTPRKAQFGDLLCVLYGSSTPFVLRRCDGTTVFDPRESYEGDYELVGDCYAHGLMDEGQVKEYVKRLDEREFRLI